MFIPVLALLSPDPRLILILLVVVVVRALVPYVLQVSLIPLVRTRSHLYSLGTKVTLPLLPTLQNYEPVPQVLKQVVNLSCYLGVRFQLR